MDWNETNNELRGFHTRNPFGSEIETVTRWNTLTENLLESTITDMFSELISDYIPNLEQNVKLVAATGQPDSLQASPDSTNPVDGAENTTQNNAWPPLEVIDYSLDGWPNSNNKPPCEVSTVEDTVSLDSDIATAVADPRTPAIHRNPSGSYAKINSVDRNPFLSGFTQSGAPAKAPKKPDENPPTTVKDNPLRYVLRTPPSRGLGSGTNNAEPSTYTPNTRASAETAPDSTVTKARKESQAVGGILGVA